MPDFYDEEDNLYRPADPVRETIQRQYGFIGRGPPPGHGRSMSILPPTLPSINTQTPAPRARSAQFPIMREPSGADAPIRIGDLEGLFQRFSLRQEEYHREQTQELRAQTSRLEAHLNDLERPVSLSAESSRGRPSARGSVGTRGKSRVSRPLRRRPPSEAAVPRASDEGAVDSTSAQGEDEADDEGDDEELSTFRTTKKNKDQTAIQKYTTRTFRGACGVKGNDWPAPVPARVNPATGVKYLSPIFHCDVTDPRNHAICVAVADRVDAEMKASLFIGSMPWNRCAKQSFRSCKAGWKKTQTPEAAERAAVNDCNTRMYRRRCTKFIHIDSQIEAFAAKFGIPFSVANNLLTQELLSDEASGPEDENEESLAAWKVRMAAAAGHTDLTPAALKNKDFVEVLECPWRSDQLSFISSSMQSLYRDAVNAGRAGNIKYIRVPTPTHRKSSRIPRISPWDFGIFFAVAG
ncbi:hypothetical protein B0H14DRAFT_3554110 [Mycena olivaceomarginata]|nr:hypothetical protein B0H14DRAFT_3554110 [Mycena olivaceomarginata]